MRRCFMRLYFLALYSCLAIPFEATAAWEYESFKMGIDEEIAKAAGVRSINSLSLDFPYQGETFGHLVLRTHPESGFNLMIILDRGQILCGIDSCEMRIKFDNEPSYSAELSPSDSYDNHLLFASQPEALEEKILRSKLMKIELKLFQSAAKILEFDVSGLDPTKIERPSLTARQAEEAARQRAEQELLVEQHKRAQEKLAAAEAEYFKKIVARIQANTSLADFNTTVGSLTSEYLVELLPNGSIKNVQLTKPSGNSTYDQAVHTAIHASAPFEANSTTGKIPASLQITIKLKR